MSEPNKLQPTLTPRDQVIGWLLDGHRDGDIREAILAKWPGEDPEKLCLAAVDHFATSASCDLAVVVGWAMEAYRDLYRRMISIGDFAGAMKAVKELTALAVKHGIQPQTEEGPAAGGTIASGQNTAEAQRIEGANGSSAEGPVS